MDGDLLKRLAVALVVGLLVGFQRERARAPLAGVRTFALISILGAIAALVAEQFDQPWIVAAALAGLAGLLVSGHAARSRKEDPELTTEVAAILVMVLGAFAMVGPLPITLAVGAGIALLLHFKEPMHGTIARLDDVEVRAVMMLVLVALLVLPLLPDRPLDPLGVLNPHQVWSMVVLIVAIGLAGYAAYKAFGRTAGTLVMGLIGGLISSTATTVEQSRRSKADAETSGLAALVVILACATAILRVVVEIAFVSLPLLARAAVPMLLVFLALAAVGVVLHVVTRGEPAPLTSGTDPAQLRTAIVFGALYAVVIVAVAASRQWFGAGGLSVVAVLSGLTDMDAITLSTAQLVRSGRLLGDEGWRVILLAALSNLVFKGLLVLLIGSRRMFVRVALAFLLALLVGGAVIVFWPEGWSAWPEGGPAGWTASALVVR